MGVNQLKLKIGIITGTIYIAITYGISLLLSLRGHALIFFIISLGYLLIQVLILKSKTTLNKLMLLGFVLDAYSALWYPGNICYAIFTIGTLMILFSYLID